VPRKRNLDPKLRRLARKIMAQTWNRPGTDKTWVVLNQYHFQDLLEEIERSRRSRVPR
jgi:hypothetical protein